MVTLSSCLIWQIISFILSPNEYGCVYAWTTLESGPAIDLKKMPIVAKKIIFSNEAHFDHGGYAKLSHLVHRKPARIHWKVDALKTSHRLVRILVQRHNWAMFEEEDIGNIWFQQDGTTYHTAAELMSFGHFRAVIWYRWTIICGMASKISVTSTSQRLLTL